MQESFNVVKGFDASIEQDWDPAFGKSHVLTTQFERRRSSVWSGK